MNKINQNNWKETILNLNKTLGDAIRSLNKTSKRIVIVMNKNKFYGVVNDGDIRRGFLKGCKISDPISKIVKKDPVVCLPNTSKKEVRKIMMKNKVDQIPIIDKNKNILGINTIDKINDSDLENILFIIAAGGFGKRLLPITSKKPKALLMINGEPMIEKIIKKASQEGFKNFIISVYYKKNIIKKYLGDGKKYGINIKYLEESKPLGTAGFLSLLKLNRNTNFVVTNCDVYPEFKYENLLNFHINNKSKATMTVKTHEIINPYGVVNTKGNKIKNIIEKPLIKSFVNVGVYIINSELLKFLKKNKFISFTVFFNLII